MEWLKWIQQVYLKTEQSLINSLFGMLAVMYCYCNAAVLTLLQDLKWCRVNCGKSCSLSNHRKTSITTYRTGFNTSQQVLKVVTDIPTVLMIQQKQQQWNDQVAQGESSITRKFYERAPLVLRATQNERYDNVIFSSVSFREQSRAEVDHHTQIFLGDNWMSNYKAGFSSCSLKASIS